MSTAAADLHPATGEAPAGDWLAVLRELTHRLGDLQRSPLLAHDPVARGIFQDMVFAPDMTEIARQCDLLIARVTELVADPPPPDLIEERAAPPARRTVLRL